VDRLPETCLLLEKGEMAVYCGKADQLPAILPEIGRLREITFRGVGEGTGLERDLDKYDEYYLHLFLWNRKTSEIVGAYRIGQVDQILRAKGVHGIYSRSLFRYHGDFIHKMGSCLEMGRSFVVPEYQKSLSALMMLWKGIGAYVAANPWYKVLFGPVSISSDYSEVSRQLMAGCLSMNNSDSVLQDLVQPTTPLKPGKGRFWNQTDLLGLTDFEKLSSLVQQIEKDNKGIPILLKQYLKLRGELAAFNVDPDFNNALDGLIIVDLMKVDERTLNKYMGASGARSFLEYNRPAA
jgi:putative hemolysin